MKFTDKTKAIPALASITSGKFKRDVGLACQKCDALPNMAKLADAEANGKIVTNSMWERAREMRGKQRGHNTRVIEARENVRNVLELVATAVGTSLSIVKHALETGHEPIVMRRFEVKGSATEVHDQLTEAKNNGVTTSQTSGKWYIHKGVKIDFAVLATTLYEQSRAFYINKEGIK